MEKGKGKGMITGGVVSEGRGRMDGWRSWRLSSMTSVHKLMVSPPLVDLGVPCARDRHIPTNLEPNLAHYPSDSKLN